MTEFRKSVYFLNFLYGDKGYANFDNAFSIIMKNFPESVVLEWKLIAHYRTITSLKTLIGRGTS